MKEARAIVLGIVVVLFIAIVWGFWKRPASGMRRVNSFRVEIDGRENGREKHLSVRIPGFLVSKVSDLASRAWENGDWNDWNFDFDGETRRITPREILEAADKSQPDKPSIVQIHGDENRLEVSLDSGIVRIKVVSLNHRREAEIQVPRLLLEGLAQQEPISPRELLKRIDTLGPGEVVSISSDEGKVRIVALGRRHSIRID